MDTQSNHDARCMGCPQCDAEWNARARKQAICQALRAFMEQRPGFDTHNYATMRDYRQDQRRAQRQLHDARELLRAVEGCDDISADALLRAAESGRLSIKACQHGESASCRCGECGARWCAECSPAPSAMCHKCNGGERAPMLPKEVRIDYCAGQYWCVEFRAGVCRVLSSALWDCERENMPAPIGSPDDRKYLLHIPGRRPVESSAGDYLRNTFRQRFGKSLAARWFD